jgi:hypothetical protein
MPRRFSEFIREQSENETRIDPATFNLQALFRDLNQRVFDNQLPADLPVTFGKVSKDAAAQTHCQTTTWRRGRRGPVFKSESDLSTLKIVCMNAPWELEELKGILAHEMIHALLTWFMAYRARLEAKAGFKIPLTHDNNLVTPVDTKPVEKKRVAFLLAQDRKGQYVYRLFTPNNVTPNDILNIQSMFRHLTLNLKYPFAAFGISDTLLTRTIPVSRKINPKDFGIYYLPNNDLSHLVPRQIITHVGTLPRFN